MSLIERINNGKKITDSAASFLEFQIKNYITKDVKKLDFDYEPLASATSSYSMDEQIETEEMQKYVHYLLSKMREREAEILRMYFGIGMDEHTAAEIAKSMNLSRGYISRIINKALRLAGCRVDHDKIRFSDLL